MKFKTFWVAIAATSALLSATSIAPFKTFASEQPETFDEVLEMEGFTEIEALETFEINRESDAIDNVIHAASIANLIG